MFAVIKGASRRRQRASARRHFHAGRRAAAARALTAARLYLDHKVPTLAAAAMHCGSNVRYVQAAIVLIQDETALHPQKICASVLEGRASLLEAAHEARQRQGARVTVKNVAAVWRRWTPAQRANFGRAVGAAQLWDGAIEPMISEERGEFAHAIAAE